MGEGNYLVCAVDGCRNRVSRSGDRALRREPMVMAVTLVGHMGPSFRVATCEVHPLPPEGYYDARVEWR